VRRGAICSPTDRSHANPMPMRQRYGTLRQVRPGSNQPPAFTSAWLWLVATLTGVLFATGLVAVTRKVVLTHLKAAKSIEAPVQGRLSTSVPIRFAMGNRGGRASH